MHDVLLLTLLTDNLILCHYFSIFYLFEVDVFQASFRGAAFKVNFEDGTEITLGSCYSSSCTVEVQNSCLLAFSARDTVGIKNFIV